MAEQRQPFRFRIPWLPGAASVPVREPRTLRPAVEPPVADERIPFQPIVRPPFRPVGIAQEPPSPPPPPPQVPSPPRKAPQPPSPPRTAPESSLPLRSTAQPEVGFRQDTATPPPVPSRPEVSPAVLSPETNLKPEAAESIPEAAQPKETPSPNVLEPQSSNEQPAKPVDSALLPDPIKADPPKALPSTPTETSLLTSVSPPSPNLQPVETSLPSPTERLVVDIKPTEPLASAALVPNLAKADLPEPSLLSDKSSLTATAQPSPESQPEETSLPRQFVQRVADESPAKPVDSASALNLAAVNPPEPTPPSQKVLPPASQESSPSGPIYRPSGESQGPFNGIISKLQEYKRVEVPDGEKVPAVAAGSVANSGKAKEKETTHPLLAMPPVPEKQPKGPSPSASASHEPKRTKFVPKKRVATASSQRANLNHLESHPRPAVARGSGSSPSSFQKEIKDDVAKLVHSITSGKANTSTIQKLVDVMNLAGENAGATMLLTSESAMGKEHIHIRRNYRSDPDESVEGTTDVDEEEEEEVDDAEDESENTMLLNSNVQGVNNSLVLDSSVSEGSPGVHFELDMKAELQFESRSESYKDNFNIMPTEKHTYKPTIRRRCLRGLFMESSDNSSSSSNDDADNPHKPRRHGCRFGCGQNNKEKHVDVA